MKLNWNSKVTQNKEKNTKSTIYNISDSFFMTSINQVQIQYENNYLFVEKFNQNPLKAARVIYIHHKMNDIKYCLLYNRKKKGNLSEMRI